MQKFFDAISSSNLTKLNAGVDNNHYYLWIGNVTVDGVSYSDVVLTYHIFEDDWSFYTDIPSQVWADFKEGTTEFLSFSGGELSNNLGGSFWFNTGTTQPHKTLQEGSPVNIDGELISKEHVLSFPDESTVNYVDIVANTAIGTNAFYQLDRSGSFIPLGSLKGRVNGFRVGKAGQTIRLRLTDNSPSQSIIEAYNIEYEVNKKRVTFKQYG